MCSVTSCPYAGRILSAALKRRGWDRIAVAALRKATHLLGLAIGTRLAQMREQERSVGGTGGVRRASVYIEEAVWINPLRDKIALQDALQPAISASAIPAPGSLQAPASH